MKALNYYATRGGVTPISKDGRQGLLIGGLC